MITGFIQKYRTIFIIVLAVFVTAGACKEGEEIERIEGSSVTTEDFKEYYDTNIEVLSRVRNVKKETLSNLLCNPDKIPPQELMAQELVRRLRPEEAYKEYREMRIIEEVARKEGFADRPLVKKMLEQVTRETLVQIYMAEQMEKSLKIADSDIEAKCQDLRDQYPRETAAMTLDDCLQYAEGLLKREIMAKQYPQIRDSIKETVQVEKNDQFDKEAFLENDIKSYLELRKAGGCPVDGASSEDTEEKSEEKAEE